MKQPDRLWSSGRRKNSTFFQMLVGTRFIASAPCERQSWADAMNRVPTSIRFFTGKDIDPRRRYAIVLCCLLLFLSGCVSLFSGTSGSPSTSPPITVTSLTTTVANPSPTALSESQLASALVQNMSLDQKLGQMVIVEFYGPTLNADLMRMIQVSGISGVLIENKNGNAVTRQQLLSLNQSMQAQAHIPLFISTDYEGGLVNELRRITGERASEATIGATRDPNVAYNAGLTAAKDLAAPGLNVNFMPIVDVLTNPNNPGLPDRTFGTDPRLVTQMGQAYLKGLTSGGVIGSLKHFPGLGSANLDPHFSLPPMNRSLATLNASALRIIQMKLRYNILTRAQAQQLLAHSGASIKSGPCINGCVTLVNVQMSGDADVRRQG